MQTTETATRTSYWLRDGGTPVESIGPLGSSSSCILAETSAGTSTSTSTSETLTVNTALGDTELYHPLVPNGNEFSSEFATVATTSYARGWIGGNNNEDLRPRICNRKY